MRKLCEYELETNRLCKNYKYNRNFCYVHDYNIFNFVFDLLFYIFVPIVLGLIVFIILNIIMYNLDTKYIYDIYDIIQYEEIFM